MPEFKGLDLADLKRVAVSIARSLADYKEPFVCWLWGPMGSGKTTLTREILYALGLDKACAVTSPTFTYMNEYRVSGDWYAHLDLYRATKGLSVEDLGVNDVRDYRGSFVEWPSSFDETDTLLKPTHTIDIQVLSDTLRTIVFTEGRS